MVMPSEAAVAAKLFGAGRAATVTGAPRIGTKTSGAAAGAVSDEDDNDDDDDDEEEEEEEADETSSGTGGRREDEVSRDTRDEAVDADEENDTTERERPVG
jgi:cobalamin biosynthesis protein CobT